MQVRNGYVTKKILESLQLTLVRTLLTKLTVNKIFGDNGIDATVQRAP